MYSELKIGCIGCGTMGGAVITAAAKKCDAKNIFITAKHADKAKAFAKQIGCTALESNLELAKKCDIIFIAVKPAFVREVLKEIRGAFDQTKLVVSMAAGLSINTLHDACRESGLSAPDHPMVSPHIIRIMPNLPVTFGEGMTALAADNDTTEEEIATIKELLADSGRVEQVGEKLMDCVTAISGSGPAYAFMFIEALADAAVKFGMSRNQAYIYAAQTLKGAATMALEDGRHVAELKDAVCSPSGTTIEAVISLEKHNFRAAVIDAATACYNKSVDLGKR